MMIIQCFFKRTDEWEVWTLIRLEQCIVSKLKQRPIITQELKPIAISMEQLKAQALTVAHHKLLSQQLQRTLTQTEPIGRLRFRHLLTTIKISILMLTSLRLKLSSTLQASERTSTPMTYKLIKVLEEWTTMATCTILTSMLSRTIIMNSKSRIEEPTICKLAQD